MQLILVEVWTLATGFCDDAASACRLYLKYKKGSPEDCPFAFDVTGKCRCRLLFDGDDDAGTDGAAAFT
ncbi:hypothetical protein, partial [Mesorhizobium sp.]|uniref:hypothetical protein n=1 Tax=Mesorhizobium sp. TaxID=1871066 RepID=UPI0025BE3F95